LVSLVLVLVSLVLVWEVDCEEEVTETSDGAMEDTLALFALLPAALME
jgi:hypothetical protein